MKDTSGPKLKQRKEEKKKKKSPDRDESESVLHEKYVHIPPLICPVVIDNMAIKFEKTKGIPEHFFWYQASSKVCK